MTFPATKIRQIPDPDHIPDPEHIPDPDCIPDLFTPLHILNPSMCFSSRTSGERFHHSPLTQFVAFFFNICLTSYSLNIILPGTNKVEGCNECLPVLILFSCSVPPIRLHVHFKIPAFEGYSPGIYR